MIAGPADPAAVAKHVVQIRPDDPRLRFRIYIDATLADQTWIDASNPDAQRITTKLQHKHHRMARTAEQAGQAWLIEIYNPAMPDDQAYLRFGTDTAGMVAPTEVPRAWVGLDNLQRIEDDEDEDD